MCVCGCLVAKVCFPISVAFSCFTGKIGRTISLLTLYVSLVTWRLLQTSLCSVNVRAFLFHFLLNFFASFTMVIERPASRSRTVHRCIVCPWRNASQAHAESASVPAGSANRARQLLQAAIGRTSSNWQEWRLRRLTRAPWPRPWSGCETERPRANSNGSD